MIRRYVVTGKFAGTDGSATASARLALGRPGILRALKLTSPGQPAGMDGTIKDETGNTLVTFTDVGNSTIGPGPVISDGWTDDGVAATDLAHGYPFRSGLAFAFTSGDADIGSNTDDAPFVCTVWVEL